MAENDGAKQRRHEAKISNERAAVLELPPVTIDALRAFVGETVFQSLWLDGLEGADSETVPAQFLIDRYASAGGLTRFLTECFPASTSKKPYGRYQLRSIATCESVIRGGGVQQSLEPRALGKSSRVTRSALWALIFGFRKCGVCFQSNLKKSRQAIDTVRNELCGNVAIRAMFPKLAAAMVHARDNLHLQRKQHFGGTRTNVQCQTEAIRLPDIFVDGEPMPFNGGRLFSMPFAKAAGLSLSDPVTLENVRPDLLLPDDVQSHDKALSGAGSDTQSLLDIWNESLRYLGGRDKAPATFFTQTIVRDGDMASQLERDPTIQTIKYGFVIRFSNNDRWWRTVYRDALLEYDPHDPNGQAKARERATALYLANRPMADDGAEVAWEFAYDPENAASAIQAGYNNLITNEQAFWTQDQNEPMRDEGGDDIRTRAEVIATRTHNASRRIVPSFADRLVAHIDVHDSLLYYGIGAGNASHQLAIIDYQTWPPQNRPYWTLENAPTKFNSFSEFRELATLEDRIKYAITTLIEHLIKDIEFLNADGYALKFDAIGIDCGDHFDLVHSVARDSKHSCVIPMRGVSPGPTGTPLNERPKKPYEKRRGDHWIEKRSDRTRSLWLEFDASYFKYRLHKGLSTPIGTSHAVSLFEAMGGAHTMFSEHCNNEKPTWIKAESKAAGAWTWKKLPGDNHFFDNAVGCYALLNRAGAKFQDVVDNKPKPIRKRITMAEAMAQHGF